MPQQCLEWVLAGIEPGEAVDTQQGGKKQRLKAVQKRRLTVMQQGKVIARMRVLMGLYRLRELGHHRTKGILLVEPMGKQMHPHKRQTGRDLDDLGARGNRPRAFSLTRASLAPIESAGGPPAGEMTKSHRKRYLPL